MYNSQYYTCEQIDQRLLQGYLDDYNTENNTSLTKAQFLAKLGSILGVWQGVDEEPTAGSHNLVESGGVERLTTLLKDNFGGVSLEEITFVNGKYINTSGSSVPNDGGVITYTDRSGNRCAAIAVTPNDVFLLNNTGNNSKWRAYAWAKSDYVFISKPDSVHTCNEEILIAPANAAWLIINDENSGYRCYKGGNIQYQIYEKIKVEKNRAETAEAVLQDNIDKNSDELSGGMLGNSIALINGYYLNTSGTSIPNNNGEVVPTSRDSNSYACIPVQEGDSFTLNTKGGNSKWRAYVWVKSDFTIITPVIDSLHECTYEKVTAPANAAYLVLNQSNQSAPDSHYGTNFKDYVDGLVSMTSGADETYNETIKGNQYQLSSYMASKRLLTPITIASKTAAVSTSGSDNQNIISNTDVLIKKGAILKIEVTGLVSVAKKIQFRINDGAVMLNIVEGEIIYECQLDVTRIRTLVQKSEIVADGNVSVTVTLLSIYNSINEVSKKSNSIDVLRYRGEMSDVYGDVLLNPVWHNSFLNIGNSESASADYISCDYIPVDTIAFLRILCECEYRVIFYGRNKERVNYIDYTGNQVITFNDKITNSAAKFVRLNVHTGSPSNIIVRCDSLVSRYNNKRLLNNNNIKCFAHQGSSLKSANGHGDNYPSSIWGAYINGYDGVHVNVRFTTDHVPYCLHDATFVDDTSSETITLENCTSTQIDGYTRDGEPIAKAESAIYMAKMMGLDVILYNIYGTKGNDDYDALIVIVKKYDMFEHVWFGIDGNPGSPNTTYLSKIVAAYPKANILRTEADIKSTDYSSITALITDAQSLLTTYPNLNIALWINAGHPEQHFIDANLAKPYNVKLAVHSLGKSQYAAVMPYISFYSSVHGWYSFGDSRRDVEKVATEKYPEFLLGNYGNVI